MNIGVVVFPGSNCDHDCQYIFKDVLGQKVEMIWHKETSLTGLDAICCREGFRMGIICGLARLRDSLRSWVR